VGRAEVEVDRSPVTMKVDQLRDVCAYAHWIPILNGLHLKLFEQNYPGWEWNDFVPKLLKKGILRVGAEDLGYTKLKLGLFVAPEVSEIEFIPGHRSVKIAVRYSSHDSSGS
jgi:hypothetical protein